MNPEELLRTTNLEKIATEGALIYQAVKGKYEANSLP
jgi:hypothetical protein